MSSPAPPSAAVASPGPEAAKSPVPVATASTPAASEPVDSDKLAATTSTPGPSSPAREKSVAPTSASSPPVPAETAADRAPEEDELPVDPDGIIDMEVFGQIQDMDDEDEEDDDPFSKGIVYGYFEQAENTFRQMEEAIAEPSLAKLSSLGHFLKGSSAALGIIKVQNSCERMQHYGNLRDEEVGVPLQEDEALRRIKQLLVDCKRDYAVASRWLRRLYEKDEA